MLRHHRSALLSLLPLACAALLGLVMSMTPAHAQRSNAIWVSATGYAYVTSPSDHESARRRALGDALVTAALSGGASLRGVSAQSMGVMVTDLSILRPTGRVLSHRLVGAQLSDDGRWSVSVEAQVAPLGADACGNGRNLVFSAYVPSVSVPPEAPAWTANRAQTLANDMIDALSRHNRVRLDRIMAAPTPSNRATPAGLDYLTLTQGVSSPMPGNHIFTPAISVHVGRNDLGRAINLAADFSIADPGGRVTRFRIERQAAFPTGNVTGLLAGRTRARGESALTNGVIREFTDILDDLGCEPPSAQMQMAGGDLVVSIGRRHGLTRGSLAVIDDANDNFGLLEITNLGRERAELRPLDPTRSLSSLAGQNVYFVETGF